jgi:hypothetical protein
MVVLRSGENPNVTEGQLESAVELIEGFLAERGFEAYLTIEVEDNSYEESSALDTVILATIATSAPFQQTIETILDGNILLRNAGFCGEPVPVFYMCRQD